MPTVDITASDARNIALAAQGFAAPRPGGRVDRRHGRRVLGHVGVIQIDSVNVLCRSQELPLLARLGAHPRDLIPRMTAGGELFEYWAHEASHCPVALHPLLRWRMADARAGVGTWGTVASIATSHRALVRRIRDQVRADGPITTRDIAEASVRTPGMWGWSPAKRALEYLFWSGQITARRGPNFERRYDLPERMIPEHVVDLPTPARAVAERELLLIAARALGVATPRDLADYFRMGITRTREHLAALVHDGVLASARVEGWRHDAVLHPSAVVPRRAAARALLSPFDSLIWNRDRTERLFGMRYRVEIYVPRAQRVHGYYVLPFLLGDRLVARVDLKADRAAGILHVRAAHLEPAEDAGRVAHALGCELETLRRFLDLTAVDVHPCGDLAPALHVAVGDTAGRT